MKRIKITVLLAILLSMVGAKTFAHDIEVLNDDGVTIYYSFINNKTELEVTYRGSFSSSYSNEYSGNVVIPETVTYDSKTYRVTSIGFYAFGYCSSLTSVNIPNSVTSIDNGAFEGCSSLTSVNIPNSVISIGHTAFMLCSSLTSITIPNGMTTINDNVFADCSSLTSVNIPNSVISIGNNAFYQCSSLTSITIPNSVISIGSYAFSGCSSLTSITIPNNVTSIGDGAFSGNSGLISIIVDDGNPMYDSRNNCNAIIETATNKLLYGCQETIIPNSVTSIGANAFCNLTSISIPNSVTSIEIWAFYKCSGLISVTIPNSVRSIGDYAFAGCESLATVVSLIDFPFIINRVFSDIASDATLHVPQGAKERYISAGWTNYFANIEEITDSDGGKTGIDATFMNAEDGTIKDVYDLGGKQFSQPQRGLNIVKMSDGTTKKIAIK